LRHQLTDVTSQTSSLNHTRCDTIECCYDEDNENVEDETFELETSVDDEHFILCNKRLDYQLRSPYLGDICLYSFFSEYRKTKMTMHDKMSLGLVNQLTTSIPRGRPPNDRWLFHSDHPQYSTHLIMRRSFAVIPVLVGPAIPRYDREDTADRYARAILTLFHPWTTVLDICRLDQSWTEALNIGQNKFTSKSQRVISNIQLLHDCRRDRDSDLFQLVNQSITTPKETILSQPYIDLETDDVEEILQVLDTNADCSFSPTTHDADESNSPQARIKREYLDFTIANVIRSQRFSHITTNESFVEFINNKPHVLTTGAIVNEVLVRSATDEDIQQIRVWQHHLKAQKDQMRHTLLFGLTNERIIVNEFHK
jgi:hypothetical protein